MKTSEFSERLNAASEHSDVFVVFNEEWRKPSEIVMKPLLWYTNDKGTLCLDYADFNCDYKRYGDHFFEVKAENEIHLKKMESYYNVQSNELNINIVIKNKGTLEL